MSEQKKHQPSNRPWNRLDPMRLAMTNGINQLFHEPQCRSTNDWAIQVARESDGVSLPALFCTDLQTAGRGRGNHEWKTNSGSLSFSLLVPDTLSLQDPRRGLLPLVVAVALCRAIESIHGSSSVRIKWPNDLMLNDRKLGGILVETACGPGKYLVIGCGINVNNDVADIPGATSLHEGLPEMDGVAIDLTGLCSAMAGEIIDGLLQIMNQQEKVIDELRKRDWLKGKRVVWKQGKTETFGIAVELTEMGGLRLQVGGIEKKVFTGSIFALD